MTDTFQCDDKDRLVAYLYREVDAATRADVERHLERCQACADEVEELGLVRQDLAGWLPPEPELGPTIVQKAALVAPRSPWRDVPVWAQAAAAVLVAAVGVAAANVQVRYDAAGLVVTTGWMTPVAAPSEGAPAVDVAVPDDGWRREMAALEARLREEIGTARPAAVPAVTAAAPAFNGRALLQQVTALVEESETRQRQELALRLTQFNRDMEMQRRADLVRIERGVGQIEGRTGAEVARQREMLNYLVRASQRPQ
jgi:hypothetical protein